MGDLISNIFSIFTSPYWLGTWLSTASLYIISANGASFCIKSGNFNLGGEGQIYLGGFITTLILTRCNLPLVPGIILAFLSAASLSGIMASLSALLKRYKKASFLLTSFIISAAIIPLLDGLIIGPLRTQGNVLAMDQIPQRFRFTSLLPPSPLNFSIFLSILLTLAIAFIFYKSNFGKELRLFGLAKEFALYSGINENKILTSAAFSSGALHGITGSLAVCGIYFTCFTDFYLGIGWSALSVAMIAKANPLFIIPSSLFMAFLIVAANKIAIYSNSNFDISGLIQGIVIFLVSIPLIKKRKAVNK